MIWAKVLSCYLRKMFAKANYARNKNARDQFRVCKRTKFAEHFRKVPPVTVMC